MSIVFFDHDEWPSPQRFQKMTKGQGISSPLEKRSWIPWESEAPPKCLLSWSWWTFPFIWGWWMPKNRHLWNHPRNNGFSKKRRDKLPGVYRWDGTFVLCTWWQGRDDHQWGWSPVLTKSLGCRLVQLRLEVFQFEILKLPEIRWRWEI